MKPIIKTIVFALILTTFSGCFSIDSAISRTNDEEHVIVANWGFLLFNTIPLVCGNATNPSSDTHGYSVFFRNDITMDNVQERFLEYSEKRGKTPFSVVYHTYDSVLFDIPFTEIPVPIPYLICYREVQISGVIK